METRTTYIDSNIFIYAFEEPTALGDFCRKILFSTQAWGIQSITSCLTYDEVVHVLRRQWPKDLVIEYAENLLFSPTVFVPTHKEILTLSLEFINATSLKTRDSIHVATMKFHNVTTIISEDKDFDAVREIRRLSAKQFLELQNHKKK